jgi:hypothetical protein
VAMTGVVDPVEHALKVRHASSMGSARALNAHPTATANNVATTGAVGPAEHAATARRATSRGSVSLVVSLNARESNAATMDVEARAGSAPKRSTAATKGSA